MDTNFSPNTEIPKKQLHKNMVCSILLIILGGLPGIIGGICGLVFNNKANAAYITNDMAEYQRQTKSTKKALRIGLIISIVCCVLLIIFNVFLTKQAMQLDTGDNIYATENITENQNVSSAAAASALSDSAGLVEQVNMTNTDGNIQYVFHEITTDYEGNPAVRICLQFTNLDTHSKSAGDAYSVQVFQDGIELPFTITEERLEKDMDSNEFTDVQSQAAIDVGYVFTLENTDSDITLQVVDWENTDNYQEQLLSSH